MIDYDGIIKNLMAEVELRLPRKRKAHTENVMAKSLEMAGVYGGDRNKIRVMALAHDLFRDKDIKGNALTHGPMAADYVRDKYGIDDEEILNGIRYHTTGCRDMGLNGKIIFLADAIEKDRDYAGVESIRKETEKGLDFGVRMSLLNTVEHLKEKGRQIDSNTLEALASIEEQSG